jgi:hypothetical protein
MGLLDCLGTQKPVGKVENEKNNSIYGAGELILAQDVEPAKPYH